MASPGIIGTALGVASPGSAYILLHHVMGDVDGSIGAWGLARGGMGAISKSLASAMQEHGGEIRVDSAPGVGSKFRFSLPCAAAAEACSEEADGVPYHSVG